MVAVRLSSISKSYGNQRVLDNVDISVETGSVFALLGPNGAGKTTVVHILTTLVTPDSGTATVAGFDVRSERNAVKKVISLTGQSVAVDEVLTGSENLMMLSKLWGLTHRASRQRTAELLEQFDLTAAGRKAVKTYSGGMRRRLDLALSLIGRPEVLFLDEPTTGLDTRSRRALWSEIISLRSSGTTIFLTTQYLEEADQLADSIALLEGGRIVAVGTPAELKARIGGEVVELRSADDELISSIPTDGSIDGLRQAVGHLDGMTAPGYTVSLRSPSLDDVFLALTGVPEGQGRS
jgi:ABC-2 type transport system ATP-binding protein